jgi:hypothetical protein
MTQLYNHRVLLSHFFLIEHIKALLIISQSIIFKLFSFIPRAHTHTPY